jgi:hypothetical protein
VNCKHCKDTGWGYDWTWVYCKECLRGLIKKRQDYDLIKKSMGPRFSESMFA